MDKPGPRLYFLDNVRTLMVMMVLVFHSGASYGSAVKFWPFHDAHPSRMIDLLMLAGDAFMMAILFFVAGYFAIPSLEKRGVGGFLKAKFKRLGIPWVVIILGVLPVLDYVHYQYQAAKAGLLPISLGLHWLMSMKKMVAGHTGWMDMSRYQTMPVFFYQRYMWFISLLLFFFVVLAAAAAFVGRDRLKGGAGAAGQDDIYKVVAITAGVSVLLFGGVRFSIYPEFMGMGWFSMGNIIQFQFGKFVLYGSYFSLGCYAFSKQWFTGGTDFGRPWIWWVMCLVLFLANFPVMILLNRSGASSLGLKIGFVILYPMWVLSFLGGFISMAMRRWKQPTPVTQELAAHSYDMYLVHYIFPMTLPLILSPYQWMPVPVKFVEVSLATVLLSYLLSRFVIRPIRSWGQLA